MSPRVLVTLVMENVPRDARDCDMLHLPVVPRGKGQRRPCFRKFYEPDGSSTECICHVQSYVDFVSQSQARYMSSVARLQGMSSNLTDVVRSNFAPLTFSNGKPCDSALSAMKCEQWVLQELLGKRVKNAEQGGQSSTGARSRPSWYTVLISFSHRLLNTGPGVVSFRASACDGFKFREVPSGERRV